MKVSKFTLLLVITFVVGIVLTFDMTAITAALVAFLIGSFVTAEHNAVVEKEERSKLKEANKAVRAFFGH